jgi:hypothetical protein
MSTSRPATPLVRLLTILLVMAAVAGCSFPGSGTAKSPSPAASSARTSSPSASASPSQAQNPSPAPPTSSFGVLVSSLSSSSYTVSLVGIDGRVIASGIANTPGTVTCGTAAAGLVPPPVSTSDSRVYFMDALGVVRFLGPNGDTGQVVTLPIGPARRSLFAVSPDGTTMSVVVLDFTATGATSRLYLYDLQPGGAQNLEFTQSGAFTLWPIGWHGPTNLVLATVPACTQGGGFGCCGPQELHVVDPKTAVRRFVIGGNGCLVSGPPTPGGVSCETSGSSDMVYSWSNQLLRTYPIPGVGEGPVYLSPNGQHLALSTNPNETTVEGGQTLSMNLCGWIDDTHILAGGDAQNQPRVGDVTSGNIVPVAAQGDCAGRIPGGL